MFPLASTGIAYLNFRDICRRTRWDCAAAAPSMKVPAIVAESQMHQTVRIRFMLIGLVMVYLRRKRKSQTMLGNEFIRYRKHCLNFLLRR